MFKIKKERVGRLKKVLSILESGQFAFQRHSKEEKENLLKQVKELTKGFEKSIKR